MLPCPLVKSHDWKELVRTGILKFCLREQLAETQQSTLFSFFDVIAELCRENHCGGELPGLQKKLDYTLALVERDFPVVIQVGNLTAGLTYKEYVNNPRS